MTPCHSSSFLYNTIIDWVAMKVIFREDVAGVAKAFEMKNISPGYARNFLFPRKLAFAVPSNEADQLIKKAEQHTARLATQHKEQSAALSTLHNKMVMLKAPGNDSGVLFGGVSEKVILAALKEQHGVVLPVGSLKLDAPIKRVGEHSVRAELGGNAATFFLRVNKI